MKTLSIILVSIIIGFLCIAGATIWELYKINSDIEAKQAEILTVEENIREIEDLLESQRKFEAEMDTLGDALVKWHLEATND